jgi:hypothetical protein
MFALTVYNGSDTKVICIGYGFPLEMELYHAIKNLNIKVIDYCNDEAVVDLDPEWVVDCLCNDNAHVVNVETDGNDLFFELFFGDED